MSALRDAVEKLGEVTRSLDPRDGQSISEAHGILEFAFGFPDRAKAIVEALEKAQRLSSMTHRGGITAAEREQGALATWLGVHGGTLLRDLATALGVATGGSDAA